MGWGEFVALCCPARVAFAQTSPLHRPLPEQPPPFSRLARLHPWGLHPEAIWSPLSISRASVACPLPKSLPKHHTENTGRWPYSHVGFQLVLLSS